MDVTNASQKTVRISDALEGYRYDASSGDIWCNAWADDGNVYSVADDTTGFSDLSNRENKANNCDSNLAFFKFIGDDPYSLDCSLVNPMREYGEAGELREDGCCWKANGMTCVDGVMYVAVSRHMYGNKETNAHQTASNASIIKSTDHGKTWSRSARENYENPMFRGRSFGAPFFIKYGKDGAGTAHQADKYVYLVSNNGYWNNGDTFSLARVPRSHIANLDSKDWQYYSGNGDDGMLDSSWNPKYFAASPIISSPERCGMSGVQYIEGLGIYVLFSWCYPELNVRDQQWLSYTEWDIYYSPTPWGKWEKACTKIFKGPGYYTPDVSGKFTSTDGTKLIVMTSGKPGSHEHYRLVVMPYTLLVG